MITCEMDMMRVKKAYKKYIKSSTDETVLLTSLRTHIHKRQTSSVIHAAYTTHRGIYVWVLMLLVYEALSY